MNNSLLKSHVLHINIPKLKYCWWDFVQFSVAQFPNLKPWAANWQNLKRHCWRIKCLSMKHCGRYLSQFNFFEQIFDWQPVYYFFTLAQASYNTFSTFSRFVHNTQVLRFDQRGGSGLGLKLGPFVSAIACLTWVCHFRLRISVFI